LISSWVRSLFVVAEVSQAALADMFAGLLPVLDERQRRLVAGAEARMRGHGGIRLVARAAGMDEDTVSRGVRELAAGVDVGAASGRVRRAGAGRPRVASRDTGLVAALLGLVEPDERGDPESPLRWTTKSLRRLAAELTGAGHPVGSDTVRNLLHQQGFTLQGTSRTLEGTRHEDRDAQFRYINEQVKAFAATGDPVVSVDAKKKETLGDYAVAGREWHRQGEGPRVRSHDFPEKNAPKAVPYGVYDVAADTGWVSVGTDADTAAFAVATLRRWWKAEGASRYPRARRLLITADAGGSNGYRVRAWKTGIAAFALETGVAVTVCHFPPGTQCRCLIIQL
jgi:Rhodopirellula transposase DDE domain